MSWLASIRGVQGGGLVEGLPTHTFHTDEGDIAMKCPTEVAITERRAARRAGNKPPSRPIASAHFSPRHSSSGETWKANTIWVKFEPRVDAV